jgi:lipopolysaccharide export system permease protein
VLFVALAFLSLFFFIDFVDELEGVGQRGRTAWHAVLAALLEVPGHLYELMPIAVLIGTIYALARWRSPPSSPSCAPAAWGPQRALGCWQCWGWPSASLTFVIGEFVAPAAERRRALLKARFAAGCHRRHRRLAQGAPHRGRGRAQRVGQRGRHRPPAACCRACASSSSTPTGRCCCASQAREGRVADDGRWTLQDVERRAGRQRWRTAAQATSGPEARCLAGPARSGLVVAAAVLPPAA